MYGYVYMTTNLVNNRKYIGRCKSSYFKGNAYLGSGKILHQAIKKYGKENFQVELLKECESDEELNQEEIRYIALYDAQKSREFYNICKGRTAGPGGPRMKGKHHSEENKRRWSEQHRGAGNANYGNHWHASEKTKAIWHAQRSGSGNVAYGTKLLNNGKVNKRIKLDEVEKYLSDGWSYGFIKKKPKDE